MRTPELVFGRAITDADACAPNPAPLFSVIGRSLQLKVEYVLWLESKSRKALV